MQASGCEMGENRQGFSYTANRLPSRRRRRPSRREVAPLMKATMTAPALRCSRSTFCLIEEVPGSNTACLLSTSRLAPSAIPGAKFRLSHRLRSSVDVAVAVLLYHHVQYDLTKTP